MIQERALRTAFKAKTEPYKDLLVKVELQSLYQRIHQNIAILMFKVKHDLVPSCI